MLKLLDAMFDEKEWGWNEILLILDTHWTLKLTLTRTKHIYRWYFLILMTMSRTKKEESKKKGGGEWDWKKVFIQWRNIARITIRNYDNTFTTTLTVRYIQIYIFRSYKGWLFLSNFMTMVKRKEMRKILPHKLFEKVVLFRSITNVYPIEKGWVT